jgi:hypothetical protein
MAKQGYRRRSNRIGSAELPPTDFSPNGGLDDPGGISTGPNTIIQELKLKETP